MSRLFYHVMQDNVGNLLFDVSGTMRLAGTGTAATIYGDAALTVPLPNPMTNHPSYGSFKCYLGPGTYDFYMAKAGYSFEPLTGLPGGGSLAQQDANAVAITGGTLTNISSLQAVGAGLGTNPAEGFALATGATPVFIGGSMGFGVNPPIARIDLRWTKATVPAIAIRPVDNDTGIGPAMQFINLAGSGVGSISTTATATAYNTSSDGRLKEAIAALPHALDVIQALRPVQFRWKATGERGQGFVAQEVQPLVPQAVTGNPADPTPNMQMDLSKLIPHLVGAVQALAQQVQVLTARLEAAGG